MFLVVEVAFVTLEHGALHRLRRQVSLGAGAGAVDVPAVSSLFSSLANQKIGENGFPPGPAPGIPVSTTLSLAWFAFFFAIAPAHAILAMPA
eukprot:1153595-Pelagomonas_calceolata.AAC.1